MLREGRVDAVCVGKHVVEGIGKLPLREGARRVTGNASRDGFKRRGRRRMRYAA